MENSNYKVIPVQKTMMDQLGFEASRYLMSRKQVGQPLKQVILKELKSSGEAALVVDFMNIEDVTVSVADELGVRLMRDYVDLWFEDGCHIPFLVYANMSEDLLDSLERVFRQQDKQLVACLFAHFDGQAFCEHHFVGDGLPDSQRNVLNLIYSLGEATSRQLEASEIAAASRKLNAISSKFPWLLQRKRIMPDERGWTYLYWPIVRTCQEAK